MTADTDTRLAALLENELVYAQDVLSDPEQLRQFKKGVVERDVASALALIAKAEGVLE